MFYEVVNKPKKIEENLLDRALTFACDYLNIDVDLVIEFETLKTNECGFCLYDSCDEGEEVIITIAKRLSLREMIVTLFHEMVHVQQYVSGRLEHGSKWLGKVYECSYAELPWEVEAHLIEQEMMEKFGGLK
jgi:hypothetical protein